MVVLILTACPVGLRGYLTRWFLEVSAGVFIGHVSSRVRELTWEKTTALVKDGRAIMVFSSHNEQHLKFRVHRHDWLPTDFDGIELMMRPSSDSLAAESASQIRPGWSAQSKWRHAAHGRHRRS